MFTHKIISKEFENGVLVFGVEFTDGTKTITEAVKPQDAAGFKHWLDARLTSLNSLAELELVNVGDSIETAKQEPTEEELAKEAFETEKATWLKKKEVLSTMIKDMEQGKSLGITPDETQVAIMKGLAEWVNGNMKQEYYF